MLQIGARLQVVWLQSRTPGEVCAFVGSEVIFPLGIRWEGKRPLPGNSDEIEIVENPKERIFRCIRIVRQYRIGDIVTVTWRRTKTGNNLVGACGDNLIWSKFHRVNWGNLLQEGLQVQVQLVEQTGFCEFRCVPAPQNSFLQKQDLRIGGEYLLEFSLGHRSSIALLSDGTAVIPAAQSADFSPRPGEIWPVMVNHIGRSIFVVPTGGRIYALENRPLPLGSVWPNRKVVKFVTSTTAIVDGETLEVNTSDWAEAPTAGQIWAVTLEESGHLEPFIRIDQKIDMPGRGVLKFEVGTDLRIVSYLRNERVVCFPCRQKWEQEFGLPHEGQVFAVNVVGRSFCGSRRVEFVEPFVQIPREYIPQWLI